MTQCYLLANKKPTNCLGQAKCSANKIRPKVVGGGILSCSLHFDKYQSEVAKYVISSVAVD